MDRDFGIDLSTWQRLSPLLDDALDLPLALRAAWIDALPAEHADLKATLRDLLARAAQAETSSLLHTLPKLDASGAADGIDDMHAAGEHVGSAPCLSPRLARGPGGRAQLAGS